MTAVSHMLKLTVEVICFFLSIGQAEKMCSQKTCQLKCRFGYQLSSYGGCYLCECYEPCLKTICDKEQVCIVQKLNNEYTAICLTHLNDCRHGQIKAHCFVNLCVLSPCLHNQNLRCITDNCGGCSARYVDKAGTDVTKQCYGVLQRPTGEQPKKSGICPTIMASGLCLDRCLGDADCPGQELCCSIGCGHVCTAPTKEILNSQKNQFLSQDQRLRIDGPKDSKVGLCPPKELLGNSGGKSCTNECSVDTDCSSVKKCCHNGCSNVCAYPSSAPVCINLRAAVEQLSERSIWNGFLPTCTPDGAFNLVQCNRAECWCVDRGGIELPQTRSYSGNPICNSSPNCPPTIACPSPCPNGYELDNSGCPICKCLDPCKEVRCRQPFETCRAIWVPCTSDPCPRAAYIPKCIPNVCPNGYPTAPFLCNATSDCNSGDSFCHTIGFQGMGICCPSLPHFPLKQRKGQCPAASALANSVSASSASLLSAAACNVECRSDVDCGADSKCCYNGCGTSCVRLKMAHEGKAAEKEGQCPAPVEHVDGPCLVSCQVDKDCPGQRKCCSFGCAKRCTTPMPETFSSTTATTIVALPETTSETTTKATPTTAPGCAVISAATCSIRCEHDYKTDRNNCTLCECRDPCENVRCENGNICLLLSGNCSFNVEQTGFSCPSTARCVPNICTGLLMDPTTGVALQCDALNQCPQNSWCRQVGLTSKGFCCPLPIAQDLHSGECPVVVATMSGQAASIECGSHCRNDNECPTSFKCCYTSCGYLGCISVPPDEKQGTCPETSEVERDPGCFQQCFTDFDCPTTRKCCRYGCSAMCTFPMEAVIPTSASTTPTGHTPQPPTTTTTIPPTSTVTISVTESIPSKSKDYKPGFCPVKAVQDSANCPSQFSECQSDSECPGITKCCNVGCGQRCLYAERTTACLHLRAVMESTGSTDSLPTCTKDGHFEEVQCRRGVCYCSDPSGEEIPGTRNNQLDQRPDCSKPPTPCEKMECDVSCPYGLDRDSQGCYTCVCKQPCSDITCSNKFEVCVIAPVKCLPGLPCRPIPSCIFNVCPRGIPMNLPGTLAPATCRDDADCPQTGFCQRAGTDPGTCCSGPAVSKHEGECPVIPPSLMVKGFLDSCQKNCSSDADCSLNTKCCMSGCGMACIAPAYPKLSAEDSFRKAGPSACFLLKATAEAIVSAGGIFAPHNYMPQCKSNAQFEELQCDDVYCWCIYPQLGSEIPGTRSWKQRSLPDCTNPHSCPAIECSLPCSYGFALDTSGCQVCACANPCNTVKCPYENQVCVLVSNDCGSSGNNCLPLPKCVPNTCQTGQPYAMVKTWIVQRCIEHRECPETHFCHQSGYEEQLGFCCIGKQPALRPGMCPSVKSLRATNTSICSHRCSTDSSCSQGSKCCFNGCGLECTGYILHDIGSMPDNDHGFQGHFGEGSSPEQWEMTIPRVQLDQRGGPLHSSRFKVQPIATIGTHIEQRRYDPGMPKRKVEKMGVCPINPINNPGCRSECESDTDCSGLKKCCQFGCGKQCQLPVHTTTCAFWSAAINAVNSDWLPKCNETGGGNFETIQCSKTHCWCVNVTNGVEELGTRQPITKPMTIDCTSGERLCNTRCSDFCPHGFKLDDSGCPADKLCRCRNPCDEISCRNSDTELCTLQRISCVTPPCPPVPKCVRHGCGLHAPLRDSTSGQALTCTGMFEGECGLSNYTCKILANQNQGFCCPASDQLKIGSCPLQSRMPGMSCVMECSQDSNCPGVQKCCDHCCAFAVNATNCIQLRSALESIVADFGSQSGIILPGCNQQTGTFLERQCSPTYGRCWCVDPQTGAEIPGTSKIGDHLNCNQLLDQRIPCAMACRELNSCPFGLEIDVDGCPLVPCRCKDLCGAINCGSQAFCAIQNLSCSAPPCMPVPLCRRNVCEHGYPLKDSISLMLKSCRAMKDCPTDHICTKSFCCPILPGAAATTVKIISTISSGLNSTVIPPGGDLTQTGFNVLSNGNAEASISNKLFVSKASNEVHSDSVHGLKQDDSPSETLFLESGTAEQEQDGKGKETLKFATQGPAFTGLIIAGSIFAVVLAVAMLTTLTVIRRRRIIREHNMKTSQIPTNFLHERTAYPRRVISNTSSDGADAGLANPLWSNSRVS